MDIFAHGLWTAAGARLVNHKTKKRTISPGWALFWGIAPDLFAFLIPMSVLVWGLISGTVDTTPFKGGQTEPEANFPLYSLSFALYHFSHSLVVFLVFFLLAYLLFKRPVWAMCGWAVHILIDIPTHSAKFFPTPFLWPLSDWKFLSGFSWGVWWFQILNYVLLIAVYVWLARKAKGNR